MAAHLLRKVSSTAPVWVLKFFGNLWPPYLGAGIRILHVASDYRYIKVCLKRSFFNMNYVGTQFGGSIYAMVDPFYMMMIMNNLGSDYIVWDKAAKIEFMKPGRTRLYAEFKINQEILDRIKQEVDTKGKHIFDLPVLIQDEDNTLIATVEKTIYVRKKPAKV